MVSSKFQLLRKGHCDFNRTVCNNKLIGAKSFLNAGAEEQRHVSPFDTIDHGTHTASIAAGAFVDTTSMLGNAMGLASGMAPRAHIAVYRVCTLDGGLAAVPALIITIGSLLLPDTPNSLIECGQAEKARDVLTKIRGITNIQDEYNDLIAASEESKLIKSPWKDMLEKKCRPPLVITILIPFFQQLTGINVIMFYAPVLFKTIGFGDSGALMSAVITGLINSLATIVSIIVVDKGGRRLLFLQGGAQMLISQLIVGGLVAYGFGTSGVGTLSKTMSTLIVVFICTYVAAFAWSWGPLGWLVPSEIFPLEIRSAGQSINVSVNMFFTFVIGQIFLTMLCHMKFGLFFFFAGWVVIMTLFIYFFLPETKNVPIEEMILVWRNHWFWSKYIGDEDIHVGTGNTAMNGRHMTAP